MEICEAKPIGKSWTEGFLTDDHVFPLVIESPSLSVTDLQIFWEKSRAFLGSGKIPLA